MKTIEEQTIKAACIVLGIGIGAIALSLLSGCGAPFGIPGPQGQTGATGAPGAPGGNCSVTTISANNAAPNGGSLIQCPDGSQSLVLNGTNGTTVTPIQFCSHQTSYPNTFSEVGFCINNNIYAIYSENDGFLTEIVPGDYSSNGENSSCSFTVGNNCQVTLN